jgi:hypothetical protein
MEIDELVSRTVAGDGAAWRSLSERVVPEIQRMARAHSGLRGRNLGTADEIAEVLTAALERLARDNYRNLSRYLAQRELARPQSFDSWLYGAVDFTVREHLRVRFGRVADKPYKRLPPSRRPGPALPGVDESLSLAHLAPRQFRAAARSSWP